jgi:hypothetical protein
VVFIDNQPVLDLIEKKPYGLLVSHTPSSFSHSPLKDSTTRPPKSSPLNHYQNMPFEAELD